MASPYDTAALLNLAVPSHVVDEDDVLRVRAYVTYQAIWDNLPTAFTVLLRASDDPLARRYVPVIRDIIESTNRYLAQDMETVWTPLPGNTIPDDAMIEWHARFDAFMTREEVGIKLLSLKRWLLIKGDAILHVTGDPSKAEGQRIRI